MKREYFIALRKEKGIAPKVIEEALSGIIESQWNFEDGWRNFSPHTAMAAFEVLSNLFDIPVSELMEMELTYQRMLADEN